MKNRILFNPFIILAIFFFGTAASGAEVLQGKCLSLDKDGHTVTVEEYDLNFDKEFPFGHPAGIQSIVNVKDAKIGAPPQVGDILRIAYVVKGQEKSALKVMNVSRQSLKK